ncbi:MAG: hypothetical protein AABW88_03405 [Nanoarchaeota archaeon]
MKIPKTIKTLGLASLIGLSDCSRFDANLLLPKYREENKTKIVKLANAVVLHSKPTPFGNSLLEYETNVDWNGFSIKVNYGDFADSGGKFGTAGAEDFISIGIDYSGKRDFYTPNETFSDNGVDGFLFRNERDHWHRHTPYSSMFDGYDHMGTSQLRFRINEEYMNIVNHTLLELSNKSKVGNKTK